MDFNEFLQESVEWLSYSFQQLKTLKNRLHRMRLIDFN